jgi:hypothetical protein
MGARRIFIQNEYHSCHLTIPIWDPLPVEALVSGVCLWCLILSVGSSATYDNFECAYAQSEPVIDAGRR